MGLLWWTVVLLAVLCLVGIALYQALKFIATRDAQNLDALPHRTVVGPAGSLKLAVADTTDSLSKGLSGHQKLKNVHGLLLVLPRKATSLTLLGVQFPLDIVWLDAQNRVLKVTYDVKPGFGTLRLPSPARTAAVIEIPALRLRKLGAIEPGTILSWK